MNRKPHILESKKITEVRNPKRSSKFVRGYGVLHSMSRNLMSLFIKIISLHNPIHFFAILYPTSLANLVVEVRTRLVTRSYSGVGFGLDKFPPSTAKALIDAVGCVCCQTLGAELTLSLVETLNQNNLITLSIFVIPSQTLASSIR